MVTNRNEIKGAKLFYYNFICFCSCNHYCKSIKLKNGIVEYSDEIHETEAKGLGSLLATVNYFPNQSSARLDKKINTYKILIIDVGPSFKNNNKKLNIYQKWGGDFSEKYLNEKPVEVVICDKNFNPEVTVPGIIYGGSLFYNPGTLFYRNSISMMEAKKLGDYLQNLNLFNSAFNTIQVSRRAAGIEMKIIIDGQSAPDLKLTKLMMHLAKEVSKKIFNNTPVMVHLCNEKFSILQTIMPA